MNTSPPRLSLQGLSCAFDGVQAVDDLSLDVGAGEIVCLLGPSGCGKSTTLRIAAGVERQQSGQVSVDGRVVSDARVHEPPEDRAIGLMFQDFALFPHLTVSENVAFVLSRRTSNRAQIVDEYLDRVGLPGFGAKYPHMLSGGEQQRVALARALAPKPRIMLMDEPFSGLDNRLRDEVRDEALSILKEEGSAVLLVTHEPDEAMRMADRIALMRAGRIVQLGAPYHVYNYPVDREAAAFFSDINVVHGVVQSRHTDTPFGLFLTPGLVDAHSCVGLAGWLTQRFDCDLFMSRGEFLRCRSTALRSWANCPAAGFGSRQIGQFWLRQSRRARFHGLRARR